MNKEMSTTLMCSDQTPVILSSSNDEIRITSVELVEIINSFRKEEGNEIEVLHKNIMSSIRNEINALKEAGVGQLNFKPSTYINSQNKELPCCSLNKAGALQILNKESAVVRFKTMQYIEKLEHNIPHKIDTSQLSPSLQAFGQLFQSMAQVEINQRQLKVDIQETKQEVQAMRDIVTLNPNQWREETTNLVNRIATFRGGTVNIYQETRKEIYQLLDSRYGINLEARLRNLRLRMAEQGASKSKRDKTSKLDVIANDKKLIEGYKQIVKEMAIKYGVA